MKNKKKIAKMRRWLKVVTLRQARNEREWQAQLGATNAKLGRLAKRVNALHERLEECDGKEAAIVTAIPLPLTSEELKVVNDTHEAAFGDEARGWHYTKDADFSEPVKPRVCLCPSPNPVPLQGVARCTHCGLPMGRVTIVN